ncbi:MAG: glycosyltransferase family 2 protein [Hyphomonadaceae bacterium]|jgi:glycosyltransferase involved in cell wall biosynthesis|nr:glycosyltransferase family 2 protein [Hyphomonadaceae bacterium]
MSEALERTTVIIPTYNRSAYLLEMLDSLFAQTLPPAEIIVADDGSTDDTPEQMAKLGDRIRYVRKANSGKSDTLNQCIKLAQHPLIWIMDDDDVALPTGLEAMTRTLSGKPEIGFVYGRYKRFSVDPTNGTRRVWDCGHWSNVEDDQFFRANLKDFFAHHPGLLVRREAYESLIPFSREYGRSEDYEMLIRLADRFDCRKTDEVIFYQRQHNGRRFGNLDGDKRMQRWIDEQTDMFKVVRANLPLSSYLPRRDRHSPLAPLQLREALIVRGVVMARKKLWSEAFEDLLAACSVEGAQGALNLAERTASRHLLFSKYGSPEILSDRAVRQGLLDLATKGPVGKELGRAIARSLVWFIRKDLLAGRPGRSWQYVTLGLSLLSRTRTAR